MTLAIAVQYPFGRLREALESLSKTFSYQYEEAIIFLTDSRWTYPDHYEDDAIKLHDIDVSTVMAYSGTANIAEHCIENLRTRINSGHKKRSNVISTIRRTYDFHKRDNDAKSKPTDKLYFLMGLHMQTGGTVLLQMESPDFKARYIRGIAGIGDRAAYEEVKKIVVPKLNNISNFNRTEKHYFTIACNVADAMRVLAIENSRFKTVGGLIQCWVLDRKGIHEHSLCYTEGPKGKRGHWHRATVKRDELTTFRDRFNLGPDYLMR